MKEIEQEYVEDNIREGQIRHWEVTLADASHAVEVAERTLEKLYAQRYRSLGEVAVGTPEIDPTL